MEVLRAIRTLIRECLLLLKGYSIVIDESPNRVFDIRLLVARSEIHACGLDLGKSTSTLIAMGLAVGIPELERLVELLESELFFVSYEPDGSLAKQILIEDSLNHLRERLELINRGYSLYIAETGHGVSLKFEQPLGLTTMDCNTDELTTSLTSFAQGVSKEKMPIVQKLLRLEEERHRLFGASPQFLEGLQQHLSGHIA